MEQYDYSIPPITVEPDFKAKVPSYESNNIGDFEDVEDSTPPDSNWSGQNFKLVRQYKTKLINCLSCCDSTPMNCNFLLCACNNIFKSSESFKIYKTTETPKNENFIGEILEISHGSSCKLGLDYKYAKYYVLDKNKKILAKIENKENGCCINPCFGGSETDYDMFFEDYCEMRDGEDNILNFVHKHSLSGKFDVKEVEVVDHDEKENNYSRKGTQVKVITTKPTFLSLHKDRNVHNEKSILWSSQPESFQKENSEALAGEDQHDHQKYSKQVNLINSEINPIKISVRDQKNKNNSASILFYKNKKTDGKHPFTFGHFCCGFEPKEYPFKGKRTEIEVNFEKDAGSTNMYNFKTQQQKAQIFLMAILWDRVGSNGGLIHKSDKQEVVEDFNVRKHGKLLNKKQKKDLGLISSSSSDYGSDCTSYNFGLNQKSIIEKFNSYYKDIDEVMSMKLLKKEEVDTFLIRKGSCAALNSANTSKSKTPLVYFVDIKVNDGNRTGLENESVKSLKFEFKNNCWYINDIIFQQFKTNSIEQVLAHYHSHPYYLGELSILLKYPRYLKVTDFLFSLPYFYDIDDFSLENIFQEKNFKLDQDKIRKACTTKNDIIFESFCQELVDNQAENTFILIGSSKVGEEKCYLVGNYMYLSTKRTCKRFKFEIILNSKDKTFSLSSCTTSNNTKKEFTSIKELVKFYKNNKIEYDNCKFYLRHGNVCSDKILKAGLEKSFENFKIEEKKENPCKTKEGHQADVEWQRLTIPDRKFEPNTGGTKLINVNF